MTTADRPQLSRTRLALFAAVPTLLTLGVALAAGELVVRYRERHRDTIPGRMETLFYPHARLGHALVRDHDYYGWASVNAQGFRGAAPTALARTPGGLRIMVVGSSTTFDVSVSPDARAWPNRLGELLRARVPRRPVEVINAGVPGYTLLDDIVRFERELAAYRPDVVVLYEGHNDLFGTFRDATHPVAHADPRRPDLVDAQTPWGRWIEHRSLLYAKLVSRLASQRLRSSVGTAIAAGADTADVLRRAIAEGSARHERQVGAFVELARAHGIRVVVPQLVHASGAGRTTDADSARLAYWRHTVPFAPPGAVLAGYAAFDAAARRAAARHGALHLPTDGWGLAGLEWYAVDDPIHFRAEGAARMAERMAEALAAAGVLDEAPAPVSPVPALVTSSR